MSQPEKSRKGEVILFNMGGEYMIARFEKIDMINTLHVRNISQIIPVPAPDGNVTISIRPFIPSMFGLISEKASESVKINLTAIPIIFYQEDLDPALVTAFIGQTTGLEVPQSGLIVPNMNLSLGTSAPPKKKRGFDDSSMPTGPDFKALLGTNEDDTDPE